MKQKLEKTYTVHAVWSHLSTKVNYAHDFECIGKRSHQPDDGDPFIYPTPECPLCAAGAGLGAGICREQSRQHPRPAVAGKGWGRGGRKGNYLFF